MTRSPYETATVWFLTGSQHLYGEETLAQVATQSQQVATTLDAALPVRVVWQPVLLDADGIVDVLRRADADPDCVGVIAWMHTFSPAKAWIRGLRELRKPLLHLHTQANRSLPWDTIDMDFMNLNQAAHGDREFGYALTRLRLPRTTVAGHVEDERVQHRVATWTRVATAWAALYGMGVARFGDNMRRVAVTDGDKVGAEQRFGVAVDTWAVNDLVTVVDDVEDATVDALVAEYLDLYDVAAELRPGGDRADALRDSARQEAGLRRFLDDGGFQAFTTTFEDLGGLKQLPGLAVQRLMADGYGFAGEGDWKTAFLVRALKVAGEGLPGGCSFMEDYTYHLGPGTPLVLGSHMLEVCPSIAEGRPAIEVHPLGIGDRSDPVRMRFTAAEGPAVVLGMCDLGGRFRMVGNAVELVPPPHDLPHLPVAAATWRPAPSFEVAAESWLLAGGPHHTVLSTSLDVEALDMLATVARTELAFIDDATTTRGFAAELRANDLHYALEGQR